MGSGTAAADWLLGGECDEQPLVEIRRRLAHARSRAEVMAILSQAVRDLLGADGATLVLREGDQCLYVEDDAISPLWKGRRFPMSAHISGWCMANRRSVAIPDIDEDPRIPADTYRPSFVRSLAMAPVGLDEPIAALGASWAEAHQPRPEELERLQAIADAAAVKLANFRRRQAGPPDQRRAEAPAAAPKVSAPSRRPAPDRLVLGAFLARLRREGLWPTSAEAYAFAAICVSVATIFMLGVKGSGVQGLAVFSAYYPAVLLAVLVGGKRCGALAATLGGLAAYYFFIPPLEQVAFVDAAGLLDLTLFGAASALIILIIDWYQRAVLRLGQEDAEHLTLAREEQHRARNAVIVVETIVRQSLPGDPVLARTINQRIRAGFADIDIHLLSRPISMGALLTQELRPFDLTRFAFDGDGDTLLAPRVSRLLTLAVHELATNALKYGALSAPGGRMTVAWRTGDGRVMLSWRETGGPPVEPPKKRGYGSIMLSRLVEAAGGAITVEFPPTGATAEISLALEPPRRSGRAIREPRRTVNPGRPPRLGFSWGFVILACGKRAGVWPAAPG